MTQRTRSLDQICWLSETESEHILSLRDNQWIWLLWPSMEGLGGGFRGGLFEIQNMPYHVESVVWNPNWGWNLVFLLYWSLEYAIVLSQFHRAHICYSAEAECSFFVCMPPARYELKSKICRIIFSKILPVATFCSSKYSKTTKYWWPGWTFQNSKIN